MSRTGFRSRNTGLSLYLEMIAPAESNRDAPAKPQLRPEHLREALAHAALEGLLPSSEGRADLEAVVNGGMNEEEFLIRLKARYGI